MKRKMNKVMVAILATALTLLFAGQVLAIGTADDQTITNTASVTFSIGGTTPPAVDSPEVEIFIDTKVRPVVSNNGDTSVVAGVNNFAIPFTVTNQSNTAAGSDYFQLTIDGTDGTDDFDMNLVGIYLDADGDGTLDAGELAIASPIVSIDNTGTNFKQYLIVANTPAAGSTPDPATPDFDAVYSLVATAWAGSAVGDGALLDDSVANGGDGNNDPDASEVVYADDAGSAPTGDLDADGFHSAAGTFTTLATLSVDKIASNGSSSTYHIPGDEVTYTITVDNPDTVEAASTVTVSDPIPVNTAYKPNSLTCTLTGSATQVNSGAGWTLEAAASGAITDVRCFEGSIAASGSASMSFIVTIN